jgi:hypothetical protein
VKVIGFDSRLLLVTQPSGVLLFRLASSICSHHLVRETTKEGQRILLQVIFGVTIGKHEELDAMFCADIVDQRVIFSKVQLPASSF